MACHCRVHDLILQSGSARRNSLGEAAYQLWIGLDADQVAPRSHHRGYVCGRNPQAAAKFHHVDAAAEKALDHTCLCAFIASPEHLRPHPR